MADFVGSMSQIDSSSLDSMAEEAISKMDLMVKDVCLAIRQFRRRPGFALAVIATLAMTIGATIAVFSVVNAVLFLALPFADPDKLVWITSVRTDNPAAPFSLPEFMDYRARTRTV